MAELFYDVHCVICSASISRYLVGSSEPDALSWRKSRVERKRLALKAGQRLQMGEPEDENRYDIENQSYDPTLVTLESLKWLTRIRGLGLSHDSTGAWKAFISGPATHFDAGEIEITRSDDPNCPTKQLFQCYEDIFPFHECCFELLARVITGSFDTHRLDKDALFKTLSELVSGVGTKLDYGPIRRIDLFWWCVPGEEYGVTHPILDDHNVKEFMVSIIDATDFGIASMNVNLAERTVSDPFNQLSYDILHIIITYLPADSLQAFIEASAIVNKATASNGFWKIAIKMKMPWFWELHELLRERLYPSVNFKGLFFWLDKHTRAKYGMSSPLMGVANRRRIWNVCQSIHDTYVLWTNGRVFNENDISAKWFMRYAKGGQLITVAHPQEGGNLITKQLVYHHDEIEKYPALFECFWNSDHELIGLGVTFSESRRIFGGPDIDLQVNDAIRTSCIIEPNGWVQGLCLHIPGVNPLGRDEHTAVKGVSLVTETPQEPDGFDYYYQRKTLGQAEGNCRPFELRGSNFVGLIGTVNENGVICRLGPLLCRLPYGGSYTSSNNEETDLQEAPQLQRLLWRPKEIPVTLDEIQGISTAFSHRTHVTGDGNCPIWAHPRFSIMPFPELEPQQDGIPNDLIPHEPVLWAEDHEEFSEITRISACINGPGGAVLGLSVQSTGRPEEAAGCLATGEPILEDHEPGYYMHHFDIDGLGGEIVTEVAVATTEQGKAIKLRTNKDREVYFGEATTQEEWDVQQAPDKTVLYGTAVKFAIAGIAMDFSTPTGWDERAQRHRFVGMTSASAIVMAEKDG